MLTEPCRVHLAVEPGAQWTELYSNKLTDPCICMQSSVHIAVELIAPGCGAMSQSPAGCSVYLAVELSSIYPLMCF